MEFILWRGGGASQEINEGGCPIVSTVH